MLGVARVGRGDVLCSDLLRGVTAQEDGHKRIFYGADATVVLRTAKPTEFAMSHSRVRLHFQLWPIALPQYDSAP